MKKPSASSDEIVSSSEAGEKDISDMADDMGDARGVSEDNVMPNINVVPHVSAMSSASLFYPAGHIPTARVPPF